MFTCDGLPAALWQGDAEKSKKGKNLGGLAAHLQCGVLLGPFAVSPCEFSEKVNTVQFHQSDSNPGPCEFHDGTRFKIADVSKRTLRRSLRLVDFNSSRWVVLHKRQHLLNSINPLRLAVRSMFFVNLQRSKSHELKAVL